MARIHVYLREATLARLRELVARKYGEGPRAISITVDQAITEYLDRQSPVTTGENRGERNGERQGCTH